MKTVDAVIGNWAAVFEAFALPPIDPKHHYDCPVCKSVKSFRIDDKEGNGTWICKHGAGNGWKLLGEVTGRDFRDLAREVDKIIGNVFAEDKIPVKRDNVAKAKSKFLTLLPLGDTHGQIYLNSRGIFRMPRMGVRWSQGEKCKEVDKSVPCLYAIASNEYGEPVYIHLTFIDNGEKAKLETVRKLYTVQESFGSVAIKLGIATNVLGIAEGIETALSATEIYKLPCWSTINANIMEKFRAPTGVTDLYIFADNDKNGTGLAAAFNCGKGNILAKNDVKKVIIRWPAKVNDFNDFLTSGDDVFEWTLSR